MWAPLKLTGPAAGSPRIIDINPESWLKVCSQPPLHPETPERPRTSAARPGKQEMPSRRATSAPPRKRTGPKPLTYQVRTGGFRGVVPPDQHGRGPRRSCRRQRAGRPGEQKYHPGEQLGTLPRRRNGPKPLTYRVRTGGFRGVVPPDQHEAGATAKPRKRRAASTNPAASNRG